MCMTVGPVAKIKAEPISWNVKDLGTLTHYNDAYVQEFNDQGQALVAGQRINGKKGQYTWMLSTPDIGIQSIPDPIPGYWAQNRWQRVNGLGIVAGTLEANTGNLNNNLFLTWWELHSGAKHYRLPLTKEHPSSGYIARCRSSDQIVISTYTDAKLGGSRDSKVFSLVNGNISELTPKLNKLAIEYGYIAGGWIIASVNSTGMMLGRFDYYEENPYRPSQSVAIGSKYFLLSGDEMSLIEFPDELLSFYSRGNSFTDLKHIFLDHEGKVMFDSFVISRGWENWIWDIQNGLRLLDQKDCIGIRGSHAKARALSLQDDGSILWMVQGCEDCNGFFIQHGTTQLRLPLDRNRQPLESDISNYEGLKVSYHIVYKTWTLYDAGNVGEFIGNSRNQIFFSGSIFGERHPFLIEPK